MLVDFPHIDRSDPRSLVAKMDNNTANAHVAGPASIEIFLFVCGGGCEVSVLFGSGDIGGVASFPPRFGA